jgi:predicted deacetylase
MNSPSGEARPPRWRISTGARTPLATRHGNVTASTGGKYAIYAEAGNY